MDWNVQPTVKQGGCAGVDTGVSLCRVRTYNGLFLSPSLPLSLCLSLSFSVGEVPLLLL